MLSECFGSGVRAFQKKLFLAQISHIDEIFVFCHNRSAAKKIFPVLSQKPYRLQRVKSSLSAIFSERYPVTELPLHVDLKVALITLLVCGCGERNLATDTHFAPEAVGAGLRQYFPEAKASPELLADITERLKRLKLVWGFIFCDELVISLTDEGFTQAEALYDERLSLGFMPLGFAPLSTDIVGDDVANTA